MWSAGFLLLFGEISAHSELRISCRNFNAEDAEFSAEVAEKISHRRLLFFLRNNLGIMHAAVARDGNKRVGLIECLDLL